MSLLLQVATVLVIALVALIVVAVLSHRPSPWNEPEPPPLPDPKPNEPRESDEPPDLGSEWYRVWLAFVVMLVLLPICFAKDYACYCARGETEEFWSDLEWYPVAILGGLLLMVAMAAGTSWARYRRASKELADEEREEPPPDSPP